MEDWQDANTTAPSPGVIQEPILTTDDLVMMVGEGAVRLREKEKREQTTAGAIAALAEERLKVESLKKKLDSCEQQALEHAREVESLNARIRQLEDQVHAVALERDEARKEILEHKASRALLEDRILARLDEFDRQIKGKRKKSER